MAEPILWANKAEASRRLPARRFNQATGAMEHLVNPETGEPMFERIPQRGHSGNSSYDDPRLERFRRYRHVLRHDGHTVRMVLTSAAADLDSNADFARYQEAKARHFGWIDVGHCPGALVLAGQIRAASLVSEEAKQSVSKPCAHGTYGENKWCPHYIAEEAARKERKTTQQERRNRDFQPDADKLIAAQKEQSKEMVAGVAKAVAESVAVALKDHGGKRKDG